MTETLRNPVVCLACLIGVVLPHDLLTMRQAIPAALTKVPGDPPGLPGRCSPTFGPFREVPGAAGSGR